MRSAQTEDRAVKGRPQRMIWILWATAFRCSTDSPSNTGREFWNAHPEKDEKKALKNFHGPAPAQEGTRVPPDRRSAFGLRPPFTKLGLYSQVAKKVRETGKPIGAPCVNIIGKSPGGDESNPSDCPRRKRHRRGWTKPLRPEPAAGRQRDVTTSAHK